MNKIYKVVVVKDFGFRNIFKISSNRNLEDIIEKIREQCNGNLISFKNIKNKYINFDRCNIKRIDVKEVNNGKFRNL